MNGRVERVKEILLDERSVEVGELSRRLAVSEVSVRKYLTDLERSGFLVRRYGGAILAENPRQVIDYLSKIEVLPERKSRIAELAAGLIDDEENVMLDAGSTTLALARRLRDRRVRVVTNSLAVANELYESETVVLEMIGGSLRKASGALIGPRARKALGDIRVDKVFLGCSGFDPKRGFSSENAVEAETKREMLSCGSQVIILADHTKFERPAFANFAAPGEVDMVVTDQRTPKMAALKKHGVKIKYHK